MKKIRCSVEGHGNCEVARFAEPLGRTAEKAELDLESENPVESSL